MKKAVCIESIRNRKLLRKRDWFGDLVGLLSISGFWVGCTFLLFQVYETRNSHIFFFVVASIPPLYAVYCLSQENELTRVETGRTADENRQIVIAAFTQLGWDISANTMYVVTAGADNKWWRGAGQTATALLDNDAIYLNIIHGATVKGRMPFYFGSNKRKLDRAIAAIKGIQALLAE